MKIPRFFLMFSVVAAAAAMSLASCRKEEATGPDKPAPEPVPGPAATRVELSVKGTFNPFVCDDASATEVCARWKDGDIVYAIGSADGSKLDTLGVLTARVLSGTDSRSASLTGSVAIPAAGTKISLVCGPALTEAPVIDGHGTASVSLASQDGIGDSFTFIACAAADYADGAYSREVTFEYATSLLRLSVNELSPDAQVNNAILNPVETACRLTFSTGAAPVAQGQESGAIIRNFLSLSSDALGSVSFYVAVPKMTADESRTIVVNQQSTCCEHLVVPDALPSGRLLEVNSIVTDLSAAGTANCYIVSGPGACKFFASSMGNDPSALISPVSADVLWETFGTAEQPAVGDLVRDVRLVDDYVHFTSSARKGNALIAVRDADSTILWSWHIWLTDVPQDQAFVDTLSKPVGTLMDRNLGATSAEPEDGALTVGLIYQWGRKDPFLTGHTYNVKQLAASTSSGWPSVPSDAQITLAETIQNPTSYCQGGNGWCSDRYYSELRILWSNGNNKTMYDPCPAGYRVMRNVYQPVFSANCVKDDSLHGFYVNMLAEGGSAWFPLGSWRHQANGLPYFNSEKAYIWTLGHNGGGCGKDNEIPLGGYEAPCASGRAVRCEKM